MRVRATILVVTAAAVLGIGLPLCLPGHLSVCRAESQTQDVELAPEIEIDAWINGDGRTSLADYRGEVVLLEFWNTH